MSILATHQYEAGGLDAALQFLKRTRGELRTLRKAQVGLDWLRVLDVNRDAFEVRGVGYAHPDVVPLLNAVNTAFDPAAIHEPTAEEYKEFDTGRRYPWAYDRVM
jgi:hypothetical protein